MELQNKLEEIKQMGAYDLQVIYGEGVGCDDSDVVQVERNTVVIYNPVGVLGSVRIMYRGTLSELLSFDFKTKPIKISNPPKREEYNDGGYFVWGTDDSVDQVLSNPFHGEWNKEDK